MSEADQVPGPATETRPSHVERLQNRKTRTKLIIFFSILIILVIVMSLIVYFCLRPDKSKHAYYENKTLGSLPRPHLEYRTWLLPSKHWNAVQVDHHRTDRFLKLVVINHSVMHGCHGKKACADELFRMQRYFREHRGWKDMPYNFAIGQAGNVYEGRGWASHGAHTRSFNNCSLGIGFLGNYNEMKPTKAQMVRLRQLLDMGVQNGHLWRNFVIVGHKDLYPTSESPGKYLYDAIKKLRRYNARRYKNMNCAQIMKSKK